jgi:acyl carrier protein
MLETDLIRFINQNLLQNRGEDISAGDSLIDLGVVNSLGLMRMMQFIETNTGVRIPDSYVTPDNFQSVNAIVDMVSGLKP